MILLITAFIFALMLYLWIPIFNGMFERLLLKISGSNVRQSVQSVYVCNELIDAFDVNYCITHFDSSILDDEEIPYSKRLALSKFMMTCSIFGLNYIYVVDQSDRILITSKSECLENKQFFIQD